MDASPWRVGGYLAPLVILAALSAVLLSSQGLVLYRYFHDVCVVFDVVARAAAEQVPHKDFPSPIGQAHFWPFWLLARHGDAGALTLLRANALVAAAIVALACISLPRRLGPALFSVAVLSAGLMAITPRGLDGALSSYSFLGRMAHLEATSCA